MRRRTAGLFALAAFAALALAVGCTGGDGGSPDVRIEPTVAATASPTLVPTAAATATPATSPTLTPAPRPAATASPTPTPPAAAGDLDGFPFSTADVRAAVQQAGFTLIPLDDHGVDCAGSSVPGLPYWSANRLGSDSGPVFVLWVYPDPDALKAEWAVTPGSAPRSRIGRCDLPTGFVYWNENLVLTFSAWLSVGAEIAAGDYPQSPGSHPAVGAFLELSR